MPNPHTFTGDPKDVNAEHEFYAENDVRMQVLRGIGR